MSKLRIKEPKNCTSGEPVRNLNGWPENSLANNGEKDLGKNRGIRVGKLGSKIILTTISLTWPTLKIPKLGLQNSDYGS